MKKISFLILTLAFLFTSCDKKGSGPAEEKSSGTKSVATDTSKAVEVPASEQPELTTLRYTVKPGDVFRYKLRSQSSMIEGDTIRTETITTQYYTKKVKSVRSDGSVELSVRYDSMSVESRLNHMKDLTKKIERKYNSGNPEDRKNPQYTPYNAYLGEEVTMLVSPKGMIEEIGGVTPIMNKILGNKRDSIPAGQRDQYIEQLKQEAYQIPLQQEYIGYPDSTIDSGRSWTRTYMLPLAGIFPTKNVVTYHIPSVKLINNRKTLDLVMNIKAVVTNPKVENPSLSIKLNSNKISGTGRALIDAEKGYTVFKKSEVTQFIEATGTDKQSKQERKMSQKMTSVTTIELLQ